LASALLFFQREAALLEVFIDGIEMEVAGSKLLLFAVVE